MSPDIWPNEELTGTTVVNIDDDRRRKLRKQAAEMAITDNPKEIWDYLENSRIFKVGQKRGKSRMYNRVYYNNIPKETIADHKLKNKIYNEYENGDYLQEVDRELSNFKNTPLKEYYSNKQIENESKYRNILTSIFKDGPIVNSLMNNLAAENRFKGNGKQIIGNAIGYFQMEPGTRGEYNRYLQRNKLNDNLKNEALFIKRKLENSTDSKKLYLIDDPTPAGKTNRNMQSWNNERLLKNIGIIKGYGNVPTDSTFYNKMKPFLGDSLAFRKNAIIETRNLRRKYEDKFNSGKAVSNTYRYVGLPISSSLNELNNNNKLTDSQASFLFNIGFERAGKPNEQLRYFGYEFK